jgi:outer membrane protein OmpA-like peptidoglycan-associated protein
MRILITGLIAFIIWSFFSMWLYVDILKPVIQPIPESQIREADSLKKFYASTPKDLMIYFEFDDARFKTDAQTDSSIVEFKNWMNKYPDYKLNVIGHTDFIGTAEYNLDLGLKRAKIIQKYLENKGISPDKIVTKNRRTEITLKK